MVNGWIICSGCQKSPAHHVTYSSGQGISGASAEGFRSTFFQLGVPIWEATLGSTAFCMKTGGQHVLWPWSVNTYSKEEGDTQVMILSLFGAYFSLVCTRMLFGKKIHVINHYQSTSSSGNAFCAYTQMPLQHRCDDVLLLKKTTKTGACTGQDVSLTFMLLVISLFMYCHDQGFTITNSSFHLADSLTLLINKLIQQQAEVRWWQICDYSSRQTDKQH